MIGWRCLVGNDGRERGLVLPQPATRPAGCLSHDITSLQLPSGIAPADSGHSLTRKADGSALEQFQRLQVGLRESHTANDWHSNLASANELKELPNEAPGSLVAVVRADVRVGEL
jgi:hypothetical protein